MGMEDWITALKSHAEKQRSIISSQANIYFTKEITDTMNNMVAGENYKFILVKNTLIPDDVDKALNSEFGTPTGKGQSTTTNIPSEKIRKSLVTLNSNMSFKKSFDLHLDLDRPSKIVKITIRSKI